MAIRRIQKWNSNIERHLAPKSSNQIEEYRRILSQLEFDRALHLGSGRDKRDLGTELESEGEIISIDPDKSGLKENGVQKSVLGDGQRLPFSDETFDLVFSEYVFEHLPDPQSALEEIDRVLKTESDFVVLVPNPNHYYARIADFTPFWFHKLWFKLQGVESIEKDRFPTQYEWGTLSDIQEPMFDWEIVEFQSFPGPTSYTNILPVHVLFILFARFMSDRPKYHVNYLVHFRT
jgi:SAM-dependent methyltransferase